MSRCRKALTHEVHGLAFWPWSHARGAAVRRHAEHEEHASSKLIRSFPAALQGVECVLEARLSSVQLVGSAVACVWSVCGAEAPLNLVNGCGRWPVANPGK